MYISVFTFLCDECSGSIYFFCGHIAKDVSFWSFKGQLFSGALIWLEESRLAVLKVTGFYGQGAQCWPSNRHEPSVMPAMCQCPTNVVNDMWKLHMRTLVNNTAIEDIDWSRRRSCGFDCLFVGTVAFKRSRFGILAFMGMTFLHTSGTSIFVTCEKWCFVMFYRHFCLEANELLWIQFAPPIENENPYPRTP